MTATDIYKAQLKRDKAHHLGRIKWLTQPHPVWSCGTTVTKNEIFQMLEKSQECIGNPSSGYNTGPKY